MDAAVLRWKHDFPMNDRTRIKIEELQKGKKSDKDKANTCRHNAFNAYLQQTCIHKQLAMSCLKSPSATVDTLLHSWAKYMQSPEHDKEKKRAQKVDPANEEAVNEKNRQVELKMRVHSLRHQLRQVRILHNKNIAYHDMSRQQQQQYDYWSSGNMEKELQELTRQHGYGKLPLDGTILQQR